MEDQFSAEAWQKLSVDERIRFCLRMARGLRKLAAAGDPKDKDAFSDLADRWEMLASQIGNAA